jgi:hypothetical protein
MTVAAIDAIGCDAAFDALACIEADLEVLTALGTHGMSRTQAMELSHRITAVSSRLAGLRFDALGILAETQAWRGNGQRSMLDVVASNEDAAVGSVRREIGLAETLHADLPLTAVALRDGRISLGKAKLLAQLAPTSDARKVALKDPDTGEAYLLARAVEVDTHQLRRVIATWAYRIDPRADDRAHLDRAHLYEIGLVDTPDGTKVNGLVSHETGDLLRTGLRAITGVPDQADTRTTAQRNAAALHTMARHLLDTGEHGSAAKVRPHLNVTVSHDTLLAPADQAGIDPATFTESGMPIPRAVLDRLTCDCELNRVIFGPDSVVLDVGRTQRIISNDQRRGVIARDRECQRPGCHAPPRYCEVHHRIWWERGGGTSVKDSVLLCFHDHEWVHTNDITIARVGNHWVFTDKEGNEVR